MMERNSNGFVLFYRGIVSFSEQVLLENTDSPALYNDPAIIRRVNI